MIDKQTKRWIKLMNIGEAMGCHQLPERSFFVKGWQFPVCARCTGALIGELTALIMLCFSVHIEFVAAMALMLPMGVDWGLQYVKILESSNIRRVITGFLGGVGITYLFFAVVKYLYCTLSELLLKIV